MAFVAGHHFLLFYIIYKNYIYYKYIKTSKYGAMLIVILDNKFTKKKKKIGMHSLAWWQGLPDMFPYPEFESRGGQGFIRPIIRNKIIHVYLVQCLALCNNEYLSDRGWFYLVGNPTLYRNPMSWLVSSRLSGFSHDSEKSELQFVIPFCEGYGDPSNPGTPKTRTELIMWRKG